MTFDTSPECGDLFAALAQALGGISSAKMDAKNPHYRSKYATLASVREATREALAANGLALTQWPVHSADDSPAYVGLVTMLAHSSGQWIRAYARMPVGKQDAHGHGSAYTYLRRYAMSAVLAVATEDDDDGNAAVEDDDGNAAVVQQPAAPARKPANAAVVQQPAAPARKPANAEATASAKDHREILRAAQERARALLELGFGGVTADDVIAGCLRPGAQVADIPARAVGAFVAKMEGWRPKYPAPPKEGDLTDEIGPPLPGTYDEETGEVTDA